MTPQTRAYLVESIPIGMEDLRITEGVDYTEFVLKRLTDGARKCIDITAMYWNLLPDTGRVDEEGFDEDQLGALGADHGRNLHQALADAAARGVQIRILQSPGFDGRGRQESDDLAAQFPDQIQIQQIQMADWYGGGIMHQKMWIFDKRHLYIGSANMDWKSIAQVKELGVVVEDHPGLAADAGKQFESFWQFSQMAPAPVLAYDSQAGVDRLAPGWSAVRPERQRQPSPLALPQLAADGNIARPLSFSSNGNQGDVFLTSSPPELCGPGRTDDLEGMLYTIRYAKEHIGISVMNFSPASSHRLPSRPPTGSTAEDETRSLMVWWPALINALLAAVARGVTVRLLVSQWAYTSSTTVPYLRALRDMAAVCQAGPEPSCGKLEVKLFQVPGWDDVSGPARRYPGHSRVNHPKFIVTDQRLNIGTSNMNWHYFVNSAGISFNSSHSGLLQKLQEIFDRDWSSAYAQLLD